MPATKLLPHQWIEVRKAYEQGVSYKKLESLYGISQQTLRKRCSHERWTSPAKLAQLSHEERNKEKMKHVSSDSMECISRAVDSETAVLLSLADLEKRHVLPTANWLQSLIQSSREQNLVQAPSNAKELATLTKLLRTELGLDKPQISLSINPWGCNNTQTKEEVSDWIDADEVGE